MKSIVDRMFGWLGWVGFNDVFSGFGESDSGRQMIPGRVGVVGRTRMACHW